LNKQQVIFEDLGIINYKSAWDYQEVLVKKNIDIKSGIRKAEANNILIDNSQLTIQNKNSNYFLF
jgi:lipoyl(octanoyl) transferase